MRFAWQKKYGLTPHDVLKMYDDQGGLCAMPLCFARLIPPHLSEGKNRTTFHIDHDHDTGEIRGLLCPDCNTDEGRWRRSESNGVREYLGLPTVNNEADAVEYLTELGYKIERTPQLSLVECETEMVA